jgi:uncharacterized protein
VQHVARIPRKEVTSLSAVQIGTEDAQSSAAVSSGERADGRRRVVDGDGHLTEDPLGVARFLPESYRREFDEGRFGLLFPPLDHFHGLPMRVRGSERHGGQVAPTGKGHVGPIEWLEFLDAVGIERTVLYPTFALSYGKIRDRAWAAAVTRAYNEWLAETYVGHDERFAGMAILPLQDPPLAVRELRYAVEHLKLSGAVLPANGLSLPVGAKEYWPVYEEAERLGCALALHGGCHDGMGFDGSNVYAPVHALGHPFGQLICLGSLLFNGAFERWPGLRVGFLEGGTAWLLLALERFEESYESHMPIDEAGELIRLPPGCDVSDYLRQLLHEGRIVVGCEGGESDTAYVVHRVGSSPFFYSSDFPHEVTVSSCLEELEALGRADLSEHDLAATLAGNAARFYRLGGSGAG